MIILLVSTWKAWTVPILIVLGIAGFLFRGFLDMTQNWNTGYGSGSRKAGIQAFVILGVFIFAAVVIGFFVSGCAFVDGLRQSTGYATTDAEYLRKHPNEYQVPCDDKIHPYDICVASR